MAIFVYHTQRDFDQASLDNVSRIITDYASIINADGNIADISQECLEHIEYIANRIGHKTVTITTYLDLITENNKELEDFHDNGKLSKSRPLGFSQGNDPRFVTRG